MRIFGREPAAIVGLGEAAFALLLAFGMFGLTSESVGLWMAVLSAALGVLTAALTSETLLGVVIGLAKAVIALAVGYGLDVDASQTAALLALITAGLGFFQRTQVSPVALRAAAHRPGPSPGVDPA